MISVRARAFAVSFALVVASTASYAACNGEDLAKVGDVTPRQVDGAIVFATRILNIDADGAPNSYRVDGRGLSYTCDGVVAIENGRRVTPSNDRKWQEKCRAAWAHATATGDYRSVAIFGFEKDASGRPIIQGAGDPLPGEAYVSATSVEIPEAPPGTQRRYVDAGAIPYIVLPGNFPSRNGIRGGDVAIAYYPATGKVVPAVFGDGGGRLDEGSVALHRALGSNPMSQSGGVERAKRRIETGPGDQRVTVIVFPGAATTPVVNADAWNRQIATVADAAFSKWGGRNRLQECTASLK